MFLSLFQVTRHVFPHNFLNNLSTYFFFFKEKKPFTKQNNIKFTNHIFHMVFNNNKLAHLQLHMLKETIYT